MSHKPGMRSEADREIAIIETATDVIPRPQPPAELSADERGHWVDLVNALPAGYFPQATLGVVRQYCRHMTVAAHLAELRHKCEAGKFSWQRYKGLIKEQRAESLIIQNLLRSMRLTHLSIKPSDRTPMPDDAGPKPWEDFVIIEGSDAAN